MLRLETGLSQYAKALLESNYVVMEAGLSDKSF